MSSPIPHQPYRTRTPPGVGTPLRARGLPGERHPTEGNRNNASTSVDFRDRVTITSHSHARGYAIGDLRNETLEGMTVTTA